jgi:hypothetical protein
MYGPANRRGQISLNHLLNFSVAPRDYHHISNASQSRRTPSYGIGSGHHPAGNPLLSMFSDYRQSTFHSSESSFCGPSKRRLPSTKYRSRHPHPVGIHLTNPRFPANSHYGLSNLSFGNTCRPTNDYMWSHCLSSVFHPLLCK